MTHCDTTELAVPHEEAGAVSLPVLPRHSVPRVTVHVRQARVHAHKPEIGRVTEVGRALVSERTPGVEPPVPRSQPHRHLKMLLYQ